MAGGCVNSVPSPHARGATRLASAPPHSRFCHQAVFTLLLGPFTFFDVQKTKYLQILTSLMRWIGESDKHLEVCLAPLIPSLPETATRARSQRWEVEGAPVDSGEQGGGRHSVPFYWCANFVPKKDKSSRGNVGKSGAQPRTTCSDCTGSPPPRGVLQGS